ncbi:MAG: TonB-dependent receptor [Rhodothermales bacterium]|nr:TonB-dependent receptor [Rhodothermales bacterium]
MRRVIVTILSIWIATIAASAFAKPPTAASGTVTGRVMDSVGEPLSSATIVLYSTADSDVARGAVTDEKGVFVFSDVAAAEYRIKVSFLGFKAFDSQPFVVEAGQSYTMPPISLEADPVALDNVQIEGEREIVEVLPDKTVLNVQGSIAATGSTALELLRKAPGVVVDNNDNIILSGKNGVKIYIDGKPSPLSTEDLAAQLRTMQSSEIDAIEIVTNPGAKYEAEGNAGIINIRLRRDKSLGFNSTIDLSYGYGKRSKYGANSTFNYRNRRYNVFGSYGYRGGEDESYINLYRIQNDFSFDERAVTENTGPSNRLRIGSDIYLGSKAVLGFLVNGYVNDRNWSNRSLTPITNLETNEIESLLDAQSINDGVRRNASFNVNLRIDNGSGTTSNADVDFGIYENGNESYQPNFYREPSSDSPIEDNIFRSQSPTDISIYAGKFDHERAMAGGKLGIGTKLSQVTTDNVYRFYDIEGIEEILDVDRSNDFRFTETIAAGYASFTGSSGSVEYSLGLRAEYTSSEGDLTAFKPANDNTVTRSYLDLFPSGGITIKPAPKHQLRVNYSRRIDRPSYQSLNPFEFKLSELSFSRGNPFLQPQYTNNVSLTHTYNYVLNTTLSYSHTDDFFARISDSTDVSRTFIESVNMDYQRVISGSISYPVSPLPWWRTYTSASGFNTRNRADLGEGRLIDVQATVVSLYHQSTFKLPSDWSFELSGWYSSPSIWGAVYKTDANYAIDVGVSREFFGGRSKVKVAVTDVFETAPWRGVQRLSGFFIDASGGWESRQLRVNISYLFGNTQVKKVRQRKTSTEDEAGRVD